MNQRAGRSGIETARGLPWIGIRVAEGNQAGHAPRAYGADKRIAAPLRCTEIMTFRSDSPAATIAGSRSTDKKGCIMRV